MHGRTAARRLRTWIVFGGLSLVGSQPIAAAADVTGVDVPEAQDPSGPVYLGILPGFEPDEMLASVTSTLQAATTCTQTTSPIVRPRSVASSDYVFSSEPIGGVPTDTWSRATEYECGARPIRRCSFRYLWDENHPELTYATVQCSGNERGKTYNYAVTATVEVQAPKRETKKPKGTTLTSLNFYTDAFPGTNSWVSMRRSRADGSVDATPVVTQFDDFTDTSQEAQPPFELDPETLEATVAWVRRTACDAVGLPSCDGQDQAVAAE